MSPADSWGDQSGQNYVSKTLYHFVGWGRKPESEQFQILKTILLSGRVIHPPTQKTIETTAQSVSINAPQKMGFGSIRFSSITMGTTRDGKPFAEVEGITVINPNAKLSENEMYSPSMICFCDIPFDKLSLHTSKYGIFGLSFNKDFLIGQGVSPVHYIARNSILPNRSDPGIDARFDAEFEDARAKHDVEFQELQNRSAAMTEFEALSNRHKLIFDNIYNKKRAEQQTATITRAELFDAKTRLIRQTLIDSAKQVSDQNLARNLRESLDFLETQIFNYVKMFDSKLDDSNQNNFYMEREWRGMNTIKFGLTDVAEVVVPTSFVEKFRNETKFEGLIRSLPSVDDDK